MGIRVNKVIGYGVDDIKYDEKQDCIVDERIKLHLFNDPDFRENLYEMEMSQWVDWTLDNKSNLREHFKREKGLSSSDAYLFWEFNFLKTNINKNNVELSRLLVHETEFLNPNVMLLIPALHFDEWSRHDDMIDWVEEGHENRYEFLSNKCRYGIYPYSNGLVRYKPHFKQNDFANKNFLSKEEAHFVKYSLDDDDVWDFENNWRPPIPVEIVSFVLWLDIFKNPREFIDSMRPMLYVYWC